MIKEKLRSSSDYTQVTISSIDKRDKITQRELIKEYIEPGIPVVLTKFAHQWEALGKVTPQYIQEKYGQHTKEVNGVTYTLAEFVDLMMASTPENPAPYPFNLNTEKYFPEIRKMAKPEIHFGKLDRINHPLLPRPLLFGTQVYEIFMGGNGARFPLLHVDALFLHNQLTQLYGSKEFILYSPEQTKYLYPSQENPKLSQVNIFKPDYDKFPLLREATPIHVTIEQGETLLFPTGWWHTTRIHEPCISFGRCHLNNSNWDNYLNDAYGIWKNHFPLLAPLVWTYGKALGKVMNLQEKLI